MKQYSRYYVCGTRQYRGHPQGTIFEAALAPDVEQRAVERGAIRVLARVSPELDPESYQLPTDWPPGEANAPANQEPPLRGSFHAGGG